MNACDCEAEAIKSFCKQTAPSGIDPAGPFAFERRCRGVAQHGRAGALGASGRQFDSGHPDHFYTDDSAGVAKSVDAADLNSAALERAGSSPAAHTSLQLAFRFEPS